MMHTLTKWSLEDYHQMIEAKVGIPEYWVVEREFDGRIYRLSIGFPTHRKIYFTANMPSPLKWTESFAFSRLKPTLCIRQGIYSLAGDDSHRTHVVDVSSAMLKVFQNPINDHYQQKKEYQDGPISTLAFPKIKISVSKLLGND